MSQDAVQLAMAFFASLGFAYFFNMHRRPLLYAALSGLLGWAVFVGLRAAMGSIFVPCLAASVVAAVIAEALARRFGAPTSIFAIVAVIPLIPGRYLFNAMQSAVEMDWAAFGENIFVTGQYALAIAIAISAVWAAVEVIDAIRGRRGAAQGQ